MSTKKVIGYASVKLSHEYGIETCCVMLKKSGVGVVQNRHGCVCGREKGEAEKEGRTPQWNLVELVLVKP